MKPSRIFSKIIGIVLIFSFLVGCSEPATPTELSAQVPTPDLPTAILDEQIPTNPLDKRSTSAQDIIAEMGVQEWDLLWVSDSSGWGVADIFAAYLAEDLGININVMDKWMGGLSAGEILMPLKGEPTYNMDLEKMRTYFHEAEIIVMYGNPLKSISEDHPMDWNCGTDALQACYVNSCGMETFGLYIEHLKEIYAIILSERDGEPTMIRTFDAYNPTIVQQCTPDGVFDACLECWENYNKAIHQAADEMGVPVANVFDAWNGPDHREDPNEKGYTKDGVHPNETGAKAIADLLRAIGYQMIIP